MSENSANESVPEAEHLGVARKPSLTPSFVVPSKETGRVMTSVASPAPHRGWNSRGYLPHWDHPCTIQSVNFRLADSIPSSVITAWQVELALTSGTDSARVTELQRRIEEYLDSGHGECWLKEPGVAQLVEDALLHFDRESYRLLAWCVMPNHVHVMIETSEGFPLGAVVGSWKSFTSKKANRQMERSGRFWQRDYFDRYVRNSTHYLAVIAYIEENPVKAGLAKIKTDWPWSSARHRQPWSAGILPALERSEGGVR